MRSIPTTAPDVEAWLIATFSDAVTVPVRNVQSKIVHPYSEVIVAADLANRVTPISRYCRVRVQAWKTRSNGTADIGGARALCAEFAAALEAAPREGILLDAEVESGPLRVTDSVTGIEYAFANVLLEVATT